MKQTEFTTKEIGENTFHIRPFSAFKAANLSGELTKLVSPVIASLTALLNGVDETGDGKKEFDIANVEVEKIVPMISGAFQSINGDIVESLIKKLLTDYQNVSYENKQNGKAEILSENAANEIFCGNIDEMYLLCYEVLKVNYGGFFAKLDSLYGKLQEVVNQK